MGGKPFSLIIKQSNTDEWYTPSEAVEMIVPFLNKGGVSQNTLPI